MKNIRILMMMGAVAVVVASCFPEDEDLSLGGTPPTASFTVEPVPNQNNTYVLTNTTPDAFITMWNTGNGFSKGEAVDTLFLPDAGDYEVQMVTASNGGSDTSDVEVVNVSTSDPEAGNIVVGGKMDDPDAWTTFTITDGVVFELVDGKMTGTGGGWGHAGFYQAIEVIADKEYAFNATVSGSGATDTWFEVYFGTSQPQPGSDYADGPIQAGLNTWTGCGNGQFSGGLLNVGCVGELMSSDGRVTFSQSGTIYLVVKSGGADLGADGISIDNIELRGTKD